MENTENRRERYNLYYIFEADRLAHPMPVDAAEKIRKNILKNFSEKLKPARDPDPPC